MKRISFVVGLAMLLTIYSSNFVMATEEEKEIYSSGDYEYTLNVDGTAAITSWNGDEEILVIPSKIDGKSVTTIGEQAFADCESIVNITIPEGITSIEAYAFIRCDSMTEIEISSSVESIAENPFAGCDSLRHIIVDEHNEVFEVIDRSLINKKEKN